MCFPIEKSVEKKWKSKTGLECVVTRADLGRKNIIEGGYVLSHRCGYVRIPPGHPWWGTDYNDISVSVHGGITFSEIEACEHEDGIGYWIGFDCAHAGDATLPPDVVLLPQFELMRPEKCEHYWTLPEVIKETERLAKQVISEMK